ncbi:MAG: 3-phenylpropionate/cinnamic acid dioxygenase subunit beta [Geminicoccaceae bacterium]
MSGIDVSKANLRGRQQEIELWWEVDQFYSYEAALLDERRYEEWLALLDPEITYLMPLARNVRRDQLGNEYSVEGQTSWFDEGYDTLAKRVAQLKTGMHWIEEPASRFSRIVANVRILGASADGERLEVESRFLVYQNRLDTEVALFAGKRLDQLKKSEGRWRVARREIRLAQSTLLAKALAFFF